MVGVKSGIGWTGCRTAHPTINKPVMSGKATRVLKDFIIVLLFWFEVVFGDSGRRLNKLGINSANQIFKKFVLHLEGALKVQWQT